MIHQQKLAMSNMTPINAGVTIDYLNFISKIIKDVDFHNASLNFSTNDQGTVGILTVGNGVDSMNITLIGQYANDGFQLSADATVGYIYLNRW